MSRLADTLAAIQGLHELFEEQAQRIERLEKELARAERRIYIENQYLTSARVARGFGPHLGLPQGADELLDVGSPFDYPANGLIYCAAPLPPPIIEPARSAPPPKPGRCASNDFAPPRGLTPAPIMYPVAALGWKPAGTAIVGHLFVAVSSASLPPVVTVATGSPLSAAAATMSTVSSVISCRSDTPPASVGGKTCKCGCDAPVANRRVFVNKDHQVRWLRAESVRRRLEAKNTRPEPRPEHPQRQPHQADHPGQQRPGPPAGTAPARGVVTRGVVIGPTGLCCRRRLRCRRRRAA